MMTSHLAAMTFRFESTEVIASAVHENIGDFEMVRLSKEPVAERFLRDVSLHEMDIRHDDGLYRHIVFQKPGTSCYLFSLTTTPGRLIYAGDMGCFVFERVQDMFSFFRANGEREPNYGYWHEKMVACDRQGSEEHNVDEFRENLERYLQDNELSEDRLSEVKEFIEEAISEFEDAGPDAAYRLVMDFGLEPERGERKRQFFQDFWETTDKVYCFRYVWACYAIQWGIKQYDSRA